MKLAILPNHEYYSKLTVEADKVVLRLPSQLGDRKIGKNKIVVFDQYLDRETGETYNHRAINDALEHVQADRALADDKSLSLLDLNIREIWSKAFSPVYREALCFISCVEQLHPTSIWLEVNDPWLGLFREIAGQIGLKMETVASFGVKDRSVSALLNAEYPSASGQSWHSPVKSGLLKKCRNASAGFLAMIVGLFQGRKPLVAFSFFKPLDLIRQSLVANDKYYPVFPDAVTAAGKKNPNLAERLNKYLAVLAGKQWRLEYRGRTIVLSDTLLGLLGKYAAASFGPLASQVDALDKLFTEKRLKGYLGYCDTPWQQRTMIRLCQKYRVPNAILINGFLNNSFYYEAKTADLTLVYGEHTKNTYLGAAGNKAAVTGTPLYEQAYARRGVVRPGFPPGKILVGTYDFSLGDINCEYACSEKYLDEVVAALRAIEKKFGRKLSITLKLHPGESRGFYEWYLKDKGYAGIGIISGGDMQEIMTHYDLLIIAHSVAVFEAALMGLPVVFYNSSRQVMFEPFTGHNKDLPSANSREQLIEVLEKMFSDKNYGRSFSDLKTLEPFTGPVDGSARANILNVVEGFIGGEK